MATLVLLITLVMLRHIGVAFNVDTLTAVIHEGAPHSMFGYSVAQHTEHSTHWFVFRLFCCVGCNVMSENYRLMFVVCIDPL